jgi:hypothetical protein
VLTSPINNRIKEAPDENRLTEPELLISSENPYIKKMRLHCERNMNDAENLARDAGEMARYHTFRARELEGK